MKNVIHVDIESSDGERFCAEREAGLILALRTFIALWYAGGGSITINPVSEEE